MVAIALMLFGLRVLALGDLSTLIPRRKKPAAAPRHGRAGARPTARRGEARAPPTCRRSAGHVHARPLEEGRLACAAKISAEGLHKPRGARPPLPARVRHRDGGRRARGGRCRHAPGSHRQARRRGEGPRATARARAAHGPRRAGSPAYVQGTRERLAGRTRHDARRARGAGCRRRPVRRERIGLSADCSPRTGSRPPNNEGAARLFDRGHEDRRARRPDPVAWSPTGSSPCASTSRRASSSRRPRASRGSASRGARAGRAAGRPRSRAIVYDVAIQFKAGELDKTLAATRAFFRALAAGAAPRRRGSSRGRVPAAGDRQGQARLARGALPRAVLRGGGRARRSRVAQGPAAVARGRRCDRDAAAPRAAVPAAARECSPPRRAYLAYRKEPHGEGAGVARRRDHDGRAQSARARAARRGRRAELERKELLSMSGPPLRGSCRIPRSASPSAGADRGSSVGSTSSGRSCCDLQDSGALDAPPAGEITVTALRERAAFVGGIAVRGRPPLRSGGGRQAHRDPPRLTALANNSTRPRTGSLRSSRRVMEQLGRIVLR